MQHLSASWAQVARRRIKTYCRCERRSPQKPAGSSDLEEVSLAQWETFGREKGIRRVKPSNDALLRPPRWTHLSAGQGSLCKQSPHPRGSCISAVAEGSQYKQLPQPRGSRISVPCWLNSSCCSHKRTCYVSAPRPSPTPRPRGSCISTLLQTVPEEPHWGGSCRR